MSQELMSPRLPQIPGSPMGSAKGSPKVYSNGSNRSRSPIAATRRIPTLRLGSGSKAGSQQSIIFQKSNNSIQDHTNDMTEFNHESMMQKEDQFTLPQVKINQEPTIELSSKIQQQPFKRKARNDGGTQMETSHLMGSLARNGMSILNNGLSGLNKFKKVNIKLPEIQLDVELDEGSILPSLQVIEHKEEKKTSKSRKTVLLSEAELKKLKKKKKKKLNMGAELKEFRKQERERVQAEEGRNLFHNLLQKEEQKITSIVDENNIENNKRIQRNLDIIQGERLRQQSWDWSINNIDQPIVGDERNLHSFIHQPLDIQEIDRDDPKLIDNLLGRLKHSCSILRELRIDELSQLNTLSTKIRNNQWYQQMYSHIEEVIQQKINQIKECVIQDTLHLIPDPDKLKKEQVPFILKRGYGNSLIRMEIEVVKMKRNNYATSFREIGITMNIQELSSYVVIVVWRNSASGFFYPSIRPQFGWYEISLFSLSDHIYSKNKKLEYILQAIPMGIQGNHNIYCQIQLPHLPILQLKKAIMVSSKEQGDYIRDLQIYDTKERVAFHLHNLAPFAIGLISQTQFPYKGWQLQLTKQEDIEFVLETQSTTIEIYVGSVVRINFQFGKKPRFLSVFQNTAEALLHLQEVGINIIPHQEDLDIFGCNLNVKINTPFYYQQVQIDNEIQAAMDITQMIPFFQFRSILSKINGRTVELEILEDSYQELNYLNEDQKTQERYNYLLTSKRYHKVKWFNSKVRVAQVEENSVNFKNFKKNEQTLSNEDFLKKYKKYISYNKLFDALESMELKPNICAYIKEKIQQENQSEIMKENFYQLLLMTKILVITGKPSL